MKNTYDIPKEVALKLCNEVLETNKRRWYTWSAWQCRGCIKWSRGDTDMLCFNSRLGHRGCSLINSRYDKMRRNAS